MSTFHCEATNRISDTFSYEATSRHSLRRDGAVTGRKAYPRNLILGRQRGEGVQDVKFAPVIKEDKAAYLRLDTGLDDDYVIDEFEDMAAKGNFYKATSEDGDLMGVCELRPVTTRYAYLGAARTGRQFRGQGVATALTAYVIDEARARGFGWIGLCTYVNNLPAQRVAEKVGLSLIGRHLTLFRGYSGEAAPRPGPEPGAVGAVGAQDPGMDGSDLSLTREGKLAHLWQRYPDSGVFPYSAFMLLPHRRELFTAEYLDTIHFQRFRDSTYWVRDEGWTIQAAFADPLAFADENLLRAVTARWQKSDVYLTLEFPVTNATDTAHALAGLSWDGDVEFWMVYGKDLT